MAGFLLALTGAACDSAADAPPAGAAAVVVTDDTGREVRLEAPARRVVSLLPAASDAVVAIGGLERLVGRTRYDREPHLAHIPSVGGGLDPSLEVLTSLRPDLVLAFETGGGSPLRGRLEALGIPVFGLQTQDTTDIFRNIHGIGTLLGLRQEADSVTAAIRAELRDVAAAVPAGPRPTVVYLADLEPPIIAGTRTFLMQMAGVAGGVPLPGLDDAVGVWPQISLEELVHRDPDLVVLPVRGDAALAVARLRAMPGWRELPAVREGRIATVDTDLASRPGPRIGELARELQAAMRPFRNRR